MSFWQERRVLITGATGFVGANIARELIYRGAEVVCLQSGSLKPNSLDALDVRTHVTVVDGAVEDVAAMERIIDESGIEVVLHLAAQSLVSTAYRSPLETFEANVRGSYSLLEACRKSTTISRIVVSSSDKAYGPAASLPYTEAHPLTGSYPYDASKVCAEVIARSFALTYGMPISITRCANTYGPGDLNLSRIIPGTVVSVLRGENPVIRSDGTPSREFIYVDDAVNAYLALAEHSDRFGGEAFNFGGGDPISMLDLAVGIIRLAGREKELMPRVMLQREVGCEIDLLFMSSAKAHQLLGWEPRFDLEDGLNRTIEWYAAHLDTFN